MISVSYTPGQLTHGPGFSSLDQLVGSVTGGGPFSSNHLTCSGIIVGLLQGKDFSSSRMSLDLK